MNKPLSYKLLTYIGYCLGKRPRFSYPALEQIIESGLKEDYKISTLRKELSYLKRDGMICFRPYYRRLVPALTPKGKLAIKTHLSFKRYGDWDQKWRLVIFNIPERERQYRFALRQKLRQLGFANMQKSIYISPYPLLGALSRWAIEQGIRQYLHLLEVAKIEDEKKMAGKIWNPQNINLRYKNFIKVGRQQLALTHKSPHWPMVAKKLEQEFAALYSQDPHLPTEFLPKNWLFDEAYKLFKEISNSY